MRFLDIKSKNYYDKLNESKKDTNIFLLIFFGLIIGFINGLFGGGGGMICVPFLSNILKLDSKTSHATTILIMLPLSICSFIVYLLNGRIDFETSLNVIIGFLIGGIIGAIILNKINNFVLQLIFSIIIIIGGIKLIL